jgi:hypothetical protein
MKVADVRDAAVYDAVNTALHLILKRIIISYFILNLFYYYFT